MEMPTFCQHCGTLFDLNDGYESEKWYQNIIICANCRCKENLEIDKDEQIEDLKIKISDSEFDIKEWKKQLKELESE